MAPVLCRVCGAQVAEERGGESHWGIGLFGFLGGGFLGFLGGYVFALALGLFALCGSLTGSGGKPANLAHAPVLIAAFTGIMAGAITARRLVTRARRLDESTAPLPLCIPCLTAAARKKRGGGSPG